MNTEYSNVMNQLKSGKFVVVPTSGVSMEPLLHDKKKKNATQVLIEPVTRTLSPGDLPLFVREDGKFVLHRLIKVYNREDGSIIYRTRGDNCITCEVFPKENAFGVVTKIYKKEKTINVTDKPYLLYVRIWNLIYPFRYLYRRIRIFAGRIKRGVKRLTIKNRK